MTTEKSTPAKKTAAKKSTARRATAAETKAQAPVEAPVAKKESAENKQAVNPFASRRVWPD